MSGPEVSPSEALVAELSLSFRDELTASIQGALGVAVEIAVVEVTKLVAHALRDVRDQMHETLRDNKLLESRLRDAESELRAVRGRLAEAQRGRPVVARLQPEIHDHDHDQTSSSATHVDLSPDRIDECLAEVEQKYSANSSGEAYDGGSFCEIREDGSVCTQDLKPDLSDEEESAAHLESTAQQEVKSELSGIKEDHLSIQEDSSHFEPMGIEPVDESEASAALAEERELHEAGTQVAVKVEKAEQCSGPESGSLSEQEEFGSDCLSLAQSRLLEDWRPESLQLQSCQSNAYTSPVSNALADPSIFPGEIPDLDFLTSPPSSQPDPFPDLPRSHRDTSSHSGEAPQQLYPAHGSGSSQHVCKLCDQSFSRQEDLRRHRSLMHPKQSSHHHKGPKQSLFPPGRSPYHCALCGRDFNRMEHLKIHQRIHTGERPYACTVCSARFRHSWALKRHFRIHTGEMPYQCGQCGKTFRNCGGLKFHQRAHARGQLA